MTSSPDTGDRRPRIALEVWSADHRQLVSTARRAEDLGFDALYYGEAPGGLNLECWTMLGVLAAATERLRIGPVIANLLPDYRSIALLAKQAATVSLVSDGRLDFRTGAGASQVHGRAWWAPYGVDYPDYDTRLERVAELVPRLRKHWSGQPTTFGAGPAVAADPPCPEVPITIAATGDRAIAVACAHADTWETSFCTPDELAGRIASAPSPPPHRSLEIDGFLAPDDSSTARLLDTVRSDRRAEDLEPVFERALIGPPARAAERIATLLDAGATQLLVALHDPHDPAALKALAEAWARAAG